MALALADCRGRHLRARPDRGQRRRLAPDELPQQRDPARALRVAPVAEFEVGPDAALGLNAAGRIEGFSVRGVRRPRRTPVSLVPRAGKPLPFRTDIRGTPIRTWNDEHGRVAAAQVEQRVRGAPWSA